MELARREFIVAGGAAAALATASAPVAARTASTLTPVAVHDPANAETRKIAGARAASGARLVALEGDRMNFWQRELAAHRGAASGCTTWADLVILRGIAAEQGLRLRAHSRHQTPFGGVFSWVLA